MAIGRLLPRLIVLALTNGLKNPPNSLTPSIDNNLPISEFVSEI